MLESLVEGLAYDAYERACRLPRKSLCSVLLEDAVNLRVRRVVYRREALEQSRDASRRNKMCCKTMLATRCELRFERVTKNGNATYKTARPFSVCDVRAMYVPISPSTLDKK